MTIDDKVRKPRPRTTHDSPNQSEQQTFREYPPKIPRGFHKVPFSVDGRPQHIKPGTVREYVGDHSTGEENAQNRVPPIQYKK